MPVDTNATETSFLNLTVPAVIAPAATTYSPTYQREPDRGILMTMFPTPMASSLAQGDGQLMTGGDALQLRVAADHAGDDPGGRVLEDPRLSPELRRHDRR